MFVKERLGVFENCFCKADRNQRDRRSISLALSKWMCGLCCEWSALEESVLYMVVRLCDETASAWYNIDDVNRGAISSDANRKICQLIELSVK